MHKGFRQERAKKGNRLENLDVDGENLLKWALNRWNGSGRTGFMWLRIRPITGFCEHNHEISRSHMKQGIPDQLKTVRPSRRHL